jgi:hypothetical protein
MEAKAALLDGLFTTLAVAKSVRFRAPEMNLLMLF